MTKRLETTISVVMLTLCVAAYNFPTRLHAYVKSRVVIQQGGTPASRKWIGVALTAILQEANKIAEGVGNLENVKQYCTPEGFAALKALVDSTAFSSNIPEYRTRLLETPDGQYEVRDINVGVRMGETAGDPIQVLVFTLNFRGDIVNVQFAIETHHYERLLDEGRKLDDLLFRKQILNFLEEFRTAHNRKDIGYLEKVYSDEALIIVGHVLKPKAGQGDYLTNSSLAETQIQFIKKSKREYIASLRQAFTRNAFVRVVFEEIEIIRHSKYADIYGIKVKQRWNSSRYSDQGYLFVMIDFREPENPVIHVRAWQPEKFPDGSEVALGDFKILD